MGSHRLGTADSTCLRGIRTGLQDLTGSEHQIVYAYEVSGWGCRISRVGNNKSNIPRMYQDEAAGSHEFGKPYRTCLEGIRTGLQDLTGSEHQIVHAYDVSGRSYRFSRVRTSERTCIWATDSHELGPKSEHAYGAAGFYGLGPQSEHAYDYLETFWIIEMQAIDL